MNMMESRNPYHKDGHPPTLRNSVLAWLDILGYQGLVKKTHMDGTGQRFLETLHAALSRSRKRVAPDTFPQFTEKDWYALKAFTDNIVIGVPIHQDGEMELGFSFGDVADYQLDMIASAGLFVRGAISVGEAYVDDIAVFGKALTDAYEAETMTARDPRIILTKSAVIAVERHIKYYGSKEGSPQAKDLLIDGDGQWFVNYLQSVLIAEDEMGPDYQLLLRHKEEVEMKLNEYQSEPPIWSKYQWVANYHNFFCTMYPRYFGLKHMIDTQLFMQHPKRITEII